MQKIALITDSACDLDLNTLREILTKEQMSLVGDLQDEINAYSGMLETEIYLQGLRGIRF